MSSAKTVVLEEYVEEAEPVAESVGVLNEFNLAGHGAVTNSSCGKFASFWGCLRTELHDHQTLDGVDYSGKVYVKKVFNSCDRPSCPKCYRYGWAVREAGKIEARLVEGSKRFGLVEHIVVSVPVRDYRLDFVTLRKRVGKVLYGRGVIGGVTIFHRDRYDRRRVFGKRWFVSPHFHVLGFVYGGYARCRGCERKWNCLKGCGRFDDVSYRGFLKDGYYVKVLGKRVTVGGTAWYQMNHSSYRVNVKRSNVATWFGTVSYRRLRVTVEKKKELCPLCQHDLERLRYLGGNPDLLACYGSSRRYGEKLGFWADGFEDGRFAWVVDAKNGWKDHG